MADWVEIAKLAVRPRYSFSIYVVSLLILLVDLPSPLRVQKIQEDFGPYIGVTALFFFIVWLVELFLLGIGQFSKCYRMFREAQKLKSRIEGLNPSEKYILAKHLVNENDTLNWSSDKTEIASLVYKGLLHKINSDSSFGTPHVVEVKVWASLLKDKENFILNAKAVNPQKTDL